MSTPIPRWAALSGVLAFVLVIAGLVVSVAGGRPQITLASSSQEVADALADPAGAGVWIGNAVEAVALLALLVFTAALTSAAARVDPGRAAVGRAAQGAAVAFVAVSLAALAAGGVVADRAGEIAGGADLAAADALNDLWGGLYALSWAPCGALLVLAALALWSTGILPRALLGAALAVGVASLVVVAAPASGAGQTIGFLPWLWFLVAGVLLARRSYAAAVADSAVGSAAGPRTWSSSARRDEVTETR